MRRTASPAPRMRQRGLSLLELGLALALMGGVVLVALQHGERGRQRHADLRSASLLERAEEAALAFALLQARLPCPAPDAGGREDCGRRVEGYLPYLTLGLPDASAGRLRYRLGVPDPAASADDGLRVLVAASPSPSQDGAGLAARAVPLRSVAAPGFHGLLDFCAVLGRPGPSSGPVPDDVAFEVEDAPAAAGGRGAVRDVRRAAIWSRLNCAPLLQAAGRAQFDIALQAAAMRVSLEDYRRQAEITRGLQAWDAAQSRWFLANASYSTMKTVIKLEIARSSWLASLKTDPAPASGMLLAAAALATAALHNAVTASTVARGAVQVEQAQRAGDALDALAARASDLDRALYAHAVRGASAPVALPWRDDVQPPALPAAPSGSDARTGIFQREATRYGHLIEGG